MHMFIIHPCIEKVVFGYFFLVFSFVLCGHGIYKVRFRKRTDGILDELRQTSYLFLAQRLIS